MGCLALPCAAQTCGYVAAGHDASACARSTSAQQSAHCQAGNVASMLDDLSGLFGFGAPPLLVVVVGDPFGIFGPIQSGRMVLGDTTVIRTTEGVFPPSVGYYSDTQERAWPPLPGIKQSVYCAEFLAVVRGKVSTQ
eukprot:3273243-Amphidinium_carterae.1